MIQLLFHRDDHIPNQFIQRLCKGSSSTSFHLGEMHCYFPEANTDANLNRAHETVCSAANG